VDQGRRPAAKRWAERARVRVILAEQPFGRGARRIVVDRHPWLLQREGDTRRILLEEGAGVTEALKAIRGPLFGLFLAAIDAGDNKAAAAISGRLHENLALVAKLTGELVPHTGTSITNILLSPDFQRLRAELIRVLARYPEAQAEVAAVFRQAGLRAATEIGASAENLIEALPVGAEHAA